MLKLNSHSTSSSRSQKLSFSVLFRQFPKPTSHSKRSPFGMDHMPSVWMCKGGFQNFNLTCQSPHLSKLNWLEWCFLRREEKVLWILKFCKFMRALDSLQILDMSSIMATKESELWSVQISFLPFQSMHVLRFHFPFVSTDSCLFVVNLPTLQTQESLKIYLFPDLQDNILREY